MSVYGRNHAQRLALRRGSLILSYRKDRAAAVAMYQKGVSSYVVAATYHVTPATVIAWVRDAGGTVRPPGRVPKVQKRQPKFKISRLADQLGISAADVKALATGRKTADEVF